MRRTMAACSLAALVISAQLALADGMFMPPRLSPRAAGETGAASTTQKAVIIDMADGKEVLLLQTTYQGPAEDFAWVIPVPGRPSRENVFEASTDFLDVVFRQTMPRVETEIEDPLAGKDFFNTLMAPQFAGGRIAGTGSVPPPQVIVHERMQVGMYDAEVLSATGTGVLAGWLVDNGYQVPHKADELLDTYVQKGWYFVALQIRPEQSPESGMVRDVDPIGIRFATDKLVFPLTISRASSRQKTEILLVVLSDVPVQCDQLSAVNLPLGKTYQPGASYATIRRTVLEDSAPGVVMEYAGGQPMPYHDLHFDTRLKWRHNSSPLVDLQGTRFWTLLNREHMDDLTFSYGVAPQREAVVVKRYAYINHPWHTLLLHTTCGQILCLTLYGVFLFLLMSTINIGQADFDPRDVRGMLVLTLVLTAIGAVLCPVGILAAIAVPVLILQAHRKSREKEGGGKLGIKAPGRTEILWALVGAGCLFISFVLLAIFAGLLQYKYNFFEHDFLGQQIDKLLTGNAATLLTFVLIALQIAWAALVWKVMRPTLADTKFRPYGHTAAIIIFFLVVVLLLEAYFGAASAHVSSVSGAWAWLLATLGSMMGLITIAAWSLLAGLIVFPHLAPQPTRLHASYLTLAVVLTLLLVFLLPFLMQFVPPAHAGGGRQSVAYRQLDRALEEIDEAVESFVAHHGCYPTRLADLTAKRKPRKGADASGNPVRLHGQWKGPYLESLPQDPCTRRNDTWNYEPTGTPMVDSGGYTLVIGTGQPEYREVRERYTRYWPHVRKAHDEGHRLYYEEEM